MPNYHACTECGRGMYRAPADLIRDGWKSVLVGTDETWICPWCRTDVPESWKPFLKPEPPRRALAAVGKDTK